MRWASFICLRSDMLRPPTSRHDDLAGPIPLPAANPHDLQAAERDAPAGVKPNDWKLIIDLPVTPRAQTNQKLDGYAVRWKIESFHKILKLDCRAADSRLRIAPRLTHLIAMLCIPAWRIF